MNPRNNVIVALIVVILASAFSGYLLGVNRSQKNISNLESDGQSWEQKFNDLKALTGETKDVDGISVAIASKPGYSRYVSKTGVTFTYKTQILNGDRMTDVIVTEGEGAGPEAIVSRFIYLSVEGGADSIQIPIYQKPTETSAIQFLRDAVGFGNKARIIVASQDPKLMVVRYNALTEDQTKKNELPVNTYAAETEQGAEFIEFTDDHSRLAGIVTPPESPSAESIDFINSISLLK